MLEYLVYFGILFFLASTIIAFINSLIRYFKAPKGSELRRKRRLPMIISSVVFAVIVSIIISLSVLLWLAVAYM